MPTLLSYVLRWVAATTVSVVVLLEVPGAALIGWAWLGQAPRAASYPGLALLLLGVALVIISGRSTRRARIEPEPEAGVIAHEI